MSGKRQWFAVYTLRGYPEDHEVDAEGNDLRTPQFDGITNDPRQEWEWAWHYPEFFIAISEEEWREAGGGKIGSGYRFTPEKLAEIEKRPHLHFRSCNDLTCEGATHEDVLTSFQELVELLEETDPYPTSDDHPLYKARRILELRGIRKQADE